MRHTRLSEGSFREIAFMRNTNYLVHSPSAATISVAAGNKETIGCTHKAYTLHGSR